MSDIANKVSNMGNPAWVRGVSGNPNGRPKVPEESRQLLKSVAPDAIRTLVSIMMNPESEDADRIRASQIIMDRAWGKPIQQVETDGIVVTPIVFDSALSGIMRKVDDGTNT